MQESGGTAEAGNRLGGGAQFADMQAAPSAGAKLCAPAACQGRSLHRPLGESSVTNSRNWFVLGRSALKRFGKESRVPLTAAVGSQGAPACGVPHADESTAAVEPVIYSGVVCLAIGRRLAASCGRLARIRHRRWRRMLCRDGQLAAKALRAPADSCVLKIDPLSGAGGKGIATGTDSSRGVRQGLPVMVRSLRSSQNFRWPRAWK